MQQPNYLIHLGLLVTILLVSACSGLAGEPEVVATLPANPNRVQASDITPPDVEPDLALGADIFAENCTRCHGPSGAGDGEFVLNGQIETIPDFTDPAANDVYTPADYFEIVTKGRVETLMPPWSGSLSDEERWAVANYVYYLADNAAEVADVADDAAGDEEISDESTESAPVAETPETIMGTLSGQLVNETADASIPNDAVVILRIFDPLMSEQTFEQHIDETGHYSFNDVPISPEFAYMVSTQYNDGLFNSDVLFADAESPDLTLDLTIYETTDDPAVIHINSIVTQVDRLPEQVRLIQYIDVTNTSDRLFIAQNRAGRSLSIGMPVPPEAQFTADNDIQRFVFQQEEGRVYDTQPIIPGESHTFHLIYRLPVSASIPITQFFNYRFEGPYEVFTGTEQITVHVDDWADLGEQQVGELIYRGTGTLAELPEGGEIAYSLRVDVPSQLPLSRKVLSIIFFAAGGVMLVVSGFLFFIGNSNKSTDKTKSMEPDNEPPSQEQIHALMKQIAELDDRHQAKQIHTNQYKKERKRLKAKLTELMQAAEFAE